MKYSFCYTIKDRTNYKIKHRDKQHVLNLLPNSINSIINSFEDKSDFEIIISDFGSTDTDYKWLDDLGINYKIVNVDHGGFFNRGMGLNKAFENSNNEYIFFIDADMLISDKLIEQTNKIFEKDSIFFPI